MPFYVVVDASDTPRTKSTAEWSLTSSYTMGYIVKRHGVVVLDDRANEKLTAARLSENADVIVTLQVFHICLFHA